MVIGGLASDRPDAEPEPSAGSSDGDRPSAALVRAIRRCSRILCAAASTAATAKMATAISSQGMRSGSTDGAAIGSAVGLGEARGGGEGWTVAATGSGAAASGTGAATTGGEGWAGGAGLLARRGSGTDAAGGTAAGRGGTLTAGGAGSVAGAGTSASRIGGGSGTSSAGLGAGRSASVGGGVRFGWSTTSSKSRPSWSRRSGRGSVGCLGRGCVGRGSARVGGGGGASDFDGAGSLCWAIADDAARSRKDSVSTRSQWIIGIPLAAITGLFRKAVKTGPARHCGAQSCVSRLFGS